MKLDPNQLVLFDTSVLVHYARDDATGRAIEADYRLTQRHERPLISTVTEGEIRGFAKFRQWGEGKISTLNKMLAELIHVPPSHPQIIESYALLYAEGRGEGYPIGQNDLWIAATAMAAKAMLMTCDKDFDWMHGRHLQRIYIHETARG